MDHTCPLGQCMPTKCLVPPLQIKQTPRGHWQVPIAPFWYSTATEREQLALARRIVRNVIEICSKCCGALIGVKTMGAPPSPFRACGRPVPRTPPSATRGMQGVGRGGQAPPLGLHRRSPLTDTGGVTTQVPLFELSLARFTSRLDPTIGMVPIL